MAASNGSDGSRDDPDNRSLTRADVLSTAEAAELLGIPRSTVHHLRASRWAAGTPRRPPLARKRRHPR
jgi:hypothetical protein